MLGPVAEGVKEGHEVPLAKPGLDQLHAEVQAIGRVLDTRPARTIDGVAKGGYVRILKTNLN